jgi:leader peptidase (prepilin peptidase)/N-methyltransferase
MDIIPLSLLEFGGVVTKTAFMPVVALVGLALGSFATAAVYRIPRDLSLWKKSKSFCTSCNTPLGPRDLVPLLSYMLQRGKCRHCAAPIGRRYPAIELSTVILSLLFYTQAAGPLDALLLCVTAMLLVALAAIDLEWKLLPDVLTLPVALCGLAYVSIDGADAVVSALIGGVLYGGLLWLAGWAVSRWRGVAALGFGDVKLIAAFGIWLGMSGDSLAIFMILTGASGVGLALLWPRLSKAGDDPDLPPKAFPFGPALILAFVALFVLGYHLRGGFF